MQIMHVNGRKAISPVIATVILIAITLIAAIAIAGFVFGLFGSFTSSAQVSVTGADITASAVQAAGGNSYLCGSTASGNYTALSNTGTSSASVSSVSIKVSGTTIPLTTTSTSCSVAAGASLYLTSISVKGASVNSGTGYLLTVTLSNGAQVPYQGEFQ